VASFSCSLLDDRYFHNSFLSRLELFVAVGDVHHVSEGEFRGHTIANEATNNGGGVLLFVQLHDTLKLTLWVDVCTDDGADAVAAMLCLDGEVEKLLG